MIGPAVDHQPASAWMPVRPALPRAIRLPAWAANEVSTSVFWNSDCASRSLFRRLFIWISAEHTDCGAIAFDLTIVIGDALLNNAQSAFFIFRLFRAATRNGIEVTVPQGFPRNRSAAFPGKSFHGTVVRFLPLQPFQRKCTSCRVPAAADFASIEGVRSGDDKQRHLISASY